jgi:hypothetical protein
MYSEHGFDALIARVRRRVPLVDRRVVLDARSAQRHAGLGDLAHELAAPQRLADRLARSAREVVRHSSSARRRA